MGTGKTHVGTELARRLGMEFLDVDVEIERREGRGIPEVFEAEGEPYFRARERDVVEELAGREALVIATGGGIVLSSECVELLGRGGDRVCLSTGVDEILKRVGTNTHRPLLAGPDRRERIEKLLRERDPYYRAIPLQVPTDGLSVSEVVDRIIEMLDA
jgi:shikimate kinase